VSLRLKRQDLLTSPEPPRVWSVIDEAALRRPVGGRSVMRGRLRHLTQIAELPRVTIQVVPFGSGAHAAASSSFSILRFAEPELPDVVYIELLTTRSTWKSARTSTTTWKSSTTSAPRPSPQTGPPAFLNEMTRET
jgi:Domain of unknown function (DUF5753)